MSRNVQPFPSPWCGRIGTTASADFCEHDSGYPGRPAFRASPTHGYASQTSPNKSVNFRCTSSPSTLESVGNGFAVHGQLTSGSLWASMAFLYVALQLWREWGRRRQSGRHLRTLSQASSPRSVASPQLPSPSTSIERLTFGILSSVQFPFSYRGLTPHKFTPMSGVHRDRGRIAADPSHTT